MAPVSLEGSGSVAIIRLGPRRRVPVLDRETLEGLDRALGRAEAGGARCVVLAGGRSGVFAAGADLQELRRLDPASARRLSLRGQRALDRLGASPAVVIAAVAGRCIGGAFDLAMACDIRVAGEAARFEHPGPLMGFITGWGGTSRLPRLLGPAAGPVLAGLMKLDADDARAAGLVSRVVSGQDVESSCLEMARRISLADAGRIRLVKRALTRIDSGRGDATLERRWAALVGCGGETT